MSINISKIVLKVDNHKMRVVPNTGGKYTRKDKNNAFKWKTLLEKSGSVCEVILEQVE